MNILFVCRDFSSNGGLERVATLICNALINKGHYVSLVSSAFPISKEGFNLSDNVECLKLPNKDEHESNDNVRFISKHIADNKIDILVYHNNSSSMMELCKKVRDKTGRPLIVVLHNEVLSMPSAYTGKLSSIKDVLKIALMPLFRVYVRRRELKARKYEYANCDKYVVLSESYVKNLEKALNIKNSDNKIVAIPNPIDIDFPIEEIHKNKELIYVGRVTRPQKRVERLLDIWELIYRKHPDWNLRIIGDGDNMADMTKRSSAMERVYFEGFCKNVYPYYAAAEICCLVSDHEGLPMTFLEASYFGTIPMSFDSFAAVGDLVPKELIVPSFDIKEYAKRLDILLSSQDLRIRLSEWTKHNAKSFSIEQIANKWSAVLTSMI